MALCRLRLHGRRVLLVSRRDSERLEVEPRQSKKDYSLTAKELKNTEKQVEALRGRLTKWEIWWSNFSSKAFKKTFFSPYAEQTGAPTPLSESVCVLTLANRPPHPPPRPVLNCRSPGRKIGFLLGHACVSIQPGEPLE